MSRAPDMFTEFAKTRGVPDGWRWFDIKILGDLDDRPNGAFQIRGAVGTADERTIIVTTKDFDAFTLQWEHDNDRCSHCCEGRQRTGTNTPPRGCRYCHGTGKGRTTSRAAAIVDLVRHCVGMKA